MNSNLKIKKILIFSMFLLILNSCTKQEIKEVTNDINPITYETFVVGGNNLQSKVLEGNILSNNSIKKSSSILGKVSELNCEPGKEVNSETLIATITPDFTDPNIKSLLNTKSSLELQLGNLEGIKLSTINNLDIQISTLNSNISSSNEQLELSKSNYDLLVKQKGLTSSDLSTQIETLVEQEKNLQKQKAILEKSKIEDLSKVESSLENIKTTSYSTIDNILLYINELYGITEEYKNNTINYDTYLSAKDSSIKTNVKTDFFKLYNLDYKTLSGEELSNFENDLNDLIKLANNGIKKSVAVANVFTETSINTYYNTLLGYSNGLLVLKTNLDNALKSNDSITNTYDTQIAGIVTSIDSLNGNIDNFKNNKSESTLLSIDVNLTNMKSQISSLESGINSQENNLKSLSQNKEITTKQLDNQLLSLRQNIDNLVINLSPQNIYAGIDGTISNNYTYLNTNVSPNSPICEIQSNGKNSLKLKVSSANKLSDGYIYSVEKDNNIIFTGSELTLLPQIDTMTQNYSYETILPEEIEFKVGDKLKVLIDYPNKDISNVDLNNEIIEVPIEYVTPRLNGYFIKSQTGSGEIIEKQVKIGEVNLPNIQVLEGLQLGDTLIK
ncbi:MAG: hypothetical protein PHV23_00215 [Candidatus Gracilibacteria bacterium]|nr:hypothetical protein [Candidatus Gracilibacteria bacterium]